MTVPSKHRVIFMGTPEFAVPALQRLAESPLVEVVLVVTQPDRPAGRGKKLTPPAVRTAAEALALPVLQSETLRDPEIKKKIVDAEPDLIVVAAFGMILGRWILELPSRGCVNLHASLLPAYRGANPIAAAIACGDDVTGVTLMKMDHGLDTGDMLAVTTEPIRSDDTTDVLTARLSIAASELLIANLEPLLAGDIIPTHQPAEATLTRPMRKADGWTDWSKTAEAVERHIRAMWPWPRAWTTSGDERIQIHAAKLGPDTGKAPGTIVHDGKRLLVACGTGSVQLTRLQLAGGRPIDGGTAQQRSEFAVGAVLGRVAPDGLEPLVTDVAPVAGGG